MTERKALKSVSIDDVKPRVMLTPIVEVYGETCKIHHIKADSIAIDGRDMFVPLRHVSKQRRRIFELENENAELVDMLGELYWCSHQLGCDRCTSRECCVTLNRMRELGIEINDDA